MLGVIISLAASLTVNDLSNGNGLNRECSDDLKLVCMGYVEGVVQDQIWLADIGATKRVFCFGGNVEVGQAVEIVQRYLQNHPEIRQERSSLLIGRAMMEAFPCPKP